MIPYGEGVAQVMEHICDHDAHGYSRINRDGDGTVETLTLSDGTQVRILGGDGDCSEMDRRCLAAMGLLPWGYWDSYMWTGNEVDLLLSNGFVEVSPYDVERGDVVWRPGHTEIYLGEGMMGGARRSETGGTHGEMGDQDGEEVSRAPYDPDEWDKAFRYPGQREPERHIVPDGGDGAVYRLYNQYKGYHFYTISRGEAQALSDIGWTDEGVAWHAPNDGDVVRRLYNRWTGQHMITTSATEAVELVGVGWQSEGVTMRSGGGVEVYRVSNPFDGDHVFTTSADERDGLVRIGWTDEGVAMKGV